MRFSYRIRIIDYICKQMRKILYFLILFGLLTGACSGGSSKQAESKKDSLPILVAKIQKCSRLYTTEYQVHKIVTHDDQLTFDSSIFGHKFNWKIPGSTRKVAIPIYATLKGYVDFSGFSSANVRRDSNRIEIILPDPQVVLTSSRIDHKRVKDRVSFFRSNFSDEELSNFERQGPESIIKSIPKLDIQERTRVSATRLLIPIVEKFGYKPESITVSFRKEFTPDSLIIIDQSEKHGL